MKRFALSLTYPPLCVNLLVSPSFPTKLPSSSRRRTLPIKDIQLDFLFDWNDILLFISHM